MYQKLVLDNGVRVVLEKIPAFKSVAVGAWVNVGSRNEKVGEEGLSHFLEHMMFKGTRRRSATQISNEIDALGGEMNAFTTHETTTFFLKVLDQQIKRGLDLLSDVFHHSRFDQREIQKEKNVVLEEIRTAQDDPEDLAQEMHARHLLDGHPLGRSILGEPKTMERLQRRDLLRYVHTHYHPQTTVIAIAGNFYKKELLPLLDRFFGKWDGDHQFARRSHSPDYPQAINGGAFVHTKRLEQVHICLGFQGLPLGHPDRYAVNILNTILGGGVSSRLFQEVREKRGLAYTIYSHLSSFSDGGVLTIYAATRPKEAASVVDVTCKQVDRLSRHGVSPKELERTKTQLKGNLMLGLEGTYGRMYKLAKDEIYQRRHISLQEMVKAIDCVSVDQVRRLCRGLLDLEKLAITALGPVKRGVFSQYVSLN